MWFWAGYDTVNERRFQLGMSYINTIGRNSVLGGSKFVQINVCQN